MNNSHQGRSYLSQQDHEFINLRNQSTVLKPNKDEKSNKNQKKQRSSHFFLELDNEQDYSFLDESFISKRSRKQQKIQEKMRKLSQKQVENENLEHNHPFIDEISSISCVNDQGTPLDSVFSIIIKQSGQNRSKDHESQNIRGQTQSPNVSFYSSQMMQPEPLEESFLVSEPLYQKPSSQIDIQQEEQKNPIDRQQNEQHRLTNKIEYAFKKSSMQFQKVNRYLLRFLRMKTDGMLVLPEYSSRLEDVSELGAEGKMLQLKISQPKKRESSRINIISLLQSKPSQKHNILVDDSFQQHINNQCFKKRKQSHNQEELPLSQIQSKKQFRQQNESDQPKN